MQYVMSDIHGHLQRFESVMEQVKLGEVDRLFVLGDVIDIHPDGIQILQKLLRMPNAHSCWATTKCLCLVLSISLPHLWQKGCGLKTAADPPMKHGSKQISLS